MFGTKRRNSIKKSVVLLSIKTSHRWGHEQIQIQEGNEGGKRSNMIWVSKRKNPIKANYIEEAKSGWYVC